uniref:Reverse transcriptase domain-containing protein n=1 Tax=Nothobranchius korthausae TaxID=1143690 RepID=A0A1A8ENL9_9TELE
MSYRPVALASLLMKTLERLILGHLRSTAGPSMDPLQFTYRPGVGLEDAVTCLLHRALAHLEKPGSTVRIMFFDFSSGFNTIQPGILKTNLE